jgi:uncharacterized membrane protein
MFSLPLHPTLVHFPIALLLIGAMLSLIALWRWREHLQDVAFWALLSGWLLTLPAIISGLIDKNDLQADSVANQVADQHTTAIFVMWGLFGLALYFQYRWRSDMTSGQRWMLTGLFVIASIVLVFAGHLGGRLVYELGVGVQ